MNREAKENLDDQVCYTVLKAPDNFPADTDMNLQKIFQRMHQSLNAAYNPGTNEHGAIAGLLEKSLANYKKSDQKQAVRQLQEIENFLAGRTRELSVCS